MSIKDTGVVNIHGKEYKTVAKRVDEFRAKYGTDWSIITSLQARNEDSVVILAEIYNENGKRVATGYAEEFRTTSQINKTSALENCETSAIGRALANLGFGGGEYASADEVANAITQQTTAKKEEQDERPTFDEVRAKLKALDNSFKINSYAKEIAPYFTTEKQKAIISQMFTERRAEVIGK